MAPQGNMCTISFNVGNKILSIIVHSQILVHPLIPFILVQTQILVHPPIPFILVQTQILVHPPILVG